MKNLNSNLDKIVGLDCALFRTDKNKVYLYSFQDKAFLLIYPDEEDAVIAYAEGENDGITFNSLYNFISRAYPTKLLKNREEAGEPFQKMKPFQNYLDFSIVRKRLLGATEILDCIAEFVVPGYLLNDGPARMLYSDLAFNSTKPFSNFEFLYHDVSAHGPVVFCNEIAFFQATVNREPYVKAITSSHRDQNFSVEHTVDNSSLSFDQAQKILEAVANHPSCRAHITRNANRMDFTLFGYELTKNTLNQE